MIHQRLQVSKVSLFFAPVAQSSQPNQKQTAVKDQEKNHVTRRIELEFKFD